VSFSSEQKKTIIEQGYKSACCRRALLFGAFFARGYASANTVTLYCEKWEYACFLAELIKEFYTKEPLIYRPSSGGRVVCLEFESKSASGYISKIDVSETLFAQKCASCHAAFLRGVFLCAGRISNPSVQYSLDFSLGDRTEIFARHLKDHGLEPRVSNKASGVILYFKTGNQIEDFCGLLALNSAMFSVIEARINGEAKKNANRIMNLDNKNLTKAVDAATAQLALIYELVNANLLSSLPEELEATARLRLENPDLTLAQLAAIATPSISKSGLSHRFKKLTELARQLLHKD